MQKKCKEKASNIFTSAVRINQSSRSSGDQSIGFLNHVRMFESCREHHPQFLSSISVHHPSRCHPRASGDPQTTDDSELVERMDPRFREDDTERCATPRSVLHRGTLVTLRGKEK
jgi:hypothetical protein